MPMIQGHRGFAFNSFVLHNTTCPALAVKREDASQASSTSRVRGSLFQTCHTSSWPGVSSISGMPPLPPGSRGPALSDHHPGHPLLLLLAQFLANGQVHVVGPILSPALDVWQEQRLQHPCVQLCCVHGSHGTHVSQFRRRGHGHMREDDARDGGVRCVGGHKAHRRACKTQHGSHQP